MFARAGAGEFHQRDNRSVAEHLHAVLERADVPTADVTVEVVDDLVRLRGQVRTDDERARVLAAVGAEAGSRQVESMLHLPNEPAPNKAPSRRPEALGGGAAAPPEPPPERKAPFRELSELEDQVAVGGGDVEPACAGGVVAEAQRDHLTAVGPRRHELGTAVDPMVHDADHERPPSREVEAVERAGVEGDEVEQDTVAEDLDVDQLAVPSLGGDAHRGRFVPEAPYRRNVPGGSVRQ